MSLTQKALDQFMKEFERNTSCGDPARVISQFADPFLAAGPDGSMVIPAALFGQQLPGRKEQFDRAGRVSSKLVDRRDTRISDRYFLVETRWRMDFAPNDKPATALTVGTSLLIDMGSAEPKILAYLPHQDIFRLMRDSRLLS
jgi:hypothetical protein